MSDDEPIILGFRQDRVGARLICILNVLRLGALFGVPARYAWLSQPDGPYPDLADPAEILSRGFVRDHLAVVDAAPDRAGRESLGPAATAMQVGQMAARIAQGERWLCDTAFEMTAFRDERRTEVAAATARLVAGLPLAGPLARARARALKRLSGVAEGPPLAIHVRRGDILDGDPWSYSAWPSKYVPDEFFRSFIDAAGGPVVAFSDTPDAVRHLARGNPRIVPVGDLIDGDLTTMQRDVLELLLMAGCSKVGAPESSAFSHAARLVGGVRVEKLPASLPRERQLAAHDALLDRAIAAPGSFFAPGDRAQSLHHAAAHARTRGRGAELLAACAGDDALLERFPFLLGSLAVLAVRSGEPDRARTLARRMAASDRLQRRDRIIGEQVALAARAMARPDGPAEADEAQYLRDLFIGRRMNGLPVPWLGGLMLARRGPAARALGLTPELVLRIVAPDAAPGAALPAEVPPWIAQTGWAELIEIPAALQQLRNWPPAPRKLASLAAVLGPAEAALAAGDAPPETGAPDLDLLGFAAAALTLDNRLMRSIRLLEWIAARRPDDALTRKRLADACAAAGNRGAALRWIDAALERAPDDGLLMLSAALRMARARPRRARALADEAAGLFPGEALAERIARRLGPKPAGRAEAAAE